MRNPSMASAAASSSSSPSKTRCCTKEGLKKGPWTAEEDELLANYVKKEGEGRWRTLPKRAGLLRCGKSCRLRWMNYLRPSVKRGQITPDEEDLILRLHRLLGNRWSLIAGRIPGRTDNEIKNYWNTHLSKKLISQGIDPRTHKPLNPNSSPEIHIPATKLNRNRSLPDPHPHTNPDPSVLEDVDNPIILEKCSNDQFNLHQGYNGVVGYENWQNSDSFMVSRHRSHGNSNEDGEMECCTDDMFSSFLNSLINDDVFVSQAQHLQTADGIAPLLSDPIVSSSHAFGYGTLWEAAGLVPSTAGFDEDEYKRITDEVNKH